MKKKKEYIFVNELNSNITITIKAYSLLEAIDILIIETKNPKDYIHLNN